MTTRKVLLIVVSVILFLAVAGVVATLFLDDFSKGLSKVKKIDKKYAFSIENYPMDFSQSGGSHLTVTDITFMSKELEELRKENKDAALSHYLNFRIALLDAEMNYKLALALGNKGSVDDGFGCKDKPVIIEAASYKNMSSQSGFEAVESLSALFDSYPEQAELIGLPKSMPLVLDTSFAQIGKKSNSTINFINRVCPD